MKKVADSAARFRVLTDLGATLLVEAAAGTGKTALMAGRLTMLLARGVEPRTVAAITFTELAASSLAARVRGYIDELLTGGVPAPLRLALPNGLEQSQRAVLSSAVQNLDGLTVATIHSFCQSIISSYAVEACVDPGVRILDATQAATAFDSVFEQWLTRRLGVVGRSSDPVAVISRDDPRRVVGTLQDLARFRLKYRGARTIAADLGGRPDIELLNAVEDFGRWLSAHPGEPKTAALVAELETLANFYRGGFEEPPDFERCWNLAHPPRLTCMRNRSFDLLKPRLKTAWQRIAGRDDGERLNDEASDCFDHVNRCYRTLLGRISTALVASLSAELDEVLQEYDAFKRSAAVVDFDDLVEKARDLVASHEGVRRELGRCYQHLLVDEFQDTDPIQTEVLFRIGASEAAECWQDCSLRAGSLFMVGDPKQAIYRFRGADIGTYSEARNAVERQWPDNIVQVTANFRSRPGIIKHVNRVFAGPLGRAGQPGYVAFTETMGEAPHRLPCVARVTIDLPRDPRSDEVREAEAEVVAEICSRLVGNLQISDEEGFTVPLGPGGIALLAPTGTELWRYERALVQRGLPIASQAGKSFLRRQEVQDMLALAGALADARDTLAFGALMRGPLVGLTEEELLDITGALPAAPEHPDGFPRFSMLTACEHVEHPIASRTLSILQELRRRARTTTPALLLTEAVERLAVRPVLAAREGDRGARAIANVEAFIERARSYGMRGLKRFIRDIASEWQEGKPQSEGRLDSEGAAIDIITIHSAKGLEWPVVIPINTATQLRSREPFVYRASDDTLHWVIGDVVPPELLRALEAEDASRTHEYERLWYVACTRARELLVLPDLPQAQQKSWARVVDVAPPGLPELDLAGMAPLRREAEPALSNLQTAEMFAMEQDAIDAVSVPLQWLRPSNDDSDRAPSVEAVAVEDDTLPEAEVPVGAGRIRGLVLHKLMEEVLTGEIGDDVPALVSRALTLLDEIGVEIGDDRALPDADEIARTASRTLHLPDIVALRATLVPEWPIYQMIADDPQPVALAGRIDAIAVEQGVPSVLLDWKSDVAPTEQDFRDHARQIGDYLEATGVERGAVVYMTSGSIRWISRPTA
ncbi:UvrD-helicase domain-containing protein (plasmid) [Ensifer adhaerens]|uniref:UvrD-helicase domain-containing protein n=1 Tax=Ensifer adhaerens TaxID=106592 RepID=UPI0023A9C07C|nr:UvrD-helicase domain-containing protein [Ensifer adhaerens]WDZ79054.1 UvrD-helicase domain-containing protein [Ensifer adhaerens]